MSNIKEAFISRFGDKGLLVEIDLVQLEVMALAELTCDPVLIAELNSGVDIHRMNASMWLKKPPASVSDAERKKAKVMTFQLTYGAGAKRMAEDLGISKDEAQAFIETFLDKYTFIAGFFIQVRHICYHSKSPVEPEHKDRTMEALVVPTQRQYTATYRQSDYGNHDWQLSPTEFKNYPVQGFATGDMVPLIINMIIDYLDNLKTRVYDTWTQGNILFINTIHDSVMFDCHEDDLAHLLSAVETVFEWLKESFEQLFNYNLQLNYNYSAKFGVNWKEVIEISRKDVQEIIK
jgi:DNA polymerase I-like protein with 3'-5' exonuclease and polymerase domains